MRCISRSKSFYTETRPIAKVRWQKIFDRIFPKLANASLNATAASSLDTNMDLASDSTTCTPTPEISFDSKSAHYPTPGSMMNLPSGSSQQHPLPSILYPSHNASSKSKKPMMPLAAYGKGPGITNPSFPVFDPAWLDQASALQSPQQVERQQNRQFE